MAAPYSMKLHLHTTILLLRARKKEVVTSHFQNCHGFRWFLSGEVRNEHFGVFLWCQSLEDYTVYSYDVSMHLIVVNIQDPRKSVKKRMRMKMAAHERFCKVGEPHVMPFNELRKRALHHDGLVIVKAELDIMPRVKREFLKPAQVTDCSLYIPGTPTRRLYVSREALSESSRIFKQIFCSQQYIHTSNGMPVATHSLKISKRELMALLYASCSLPLAIDEKNLKFYMRLGLKFQSDKILQACFSALLQLKTMEAKLSFVPIALQCGGMEMFLEHVAGTADSNSIRQFLLSPDGSNVDPNFKEKLIKRIKSNKQSACVLIGNASTKAKHLFTNRRAA
ncbi:hypothetical protein QR680_007311 [Steinernema hermaphroditum]|uniref:BTB domain-containing protein n=1 Tax=Steinernema hermaphroditum TaxID=289476 RepID=A0AA39M571_9BILA|nr:hypothetical protein QR680_007311 [Steinernema hermaphroditum]